MDVSLGVAGTASLGDAAVTRAAVCRLRPEPAGGPFYLPLGMVRRDITEGFAGVPLMLRVRIVDAATGKAVRGAVLDIRHCAATGAGPRVLPIDVVDVPLAAPLPRAAPDDGRKFLRGVQMSDAEGDVQFRTIFPGWCAGRSIHIHAKVYVGGQVTHTGRLFVDERLAERMARLRPYCGNPAARTPNAEDEHFPDGGLLLVVPRDRYDLEAGLLATVTVAIDGGNTTVTDGSSDSRGMLG